RAEALFLQEELVAAAQELVWVAQKADDIRLREKALEVLPRLAEKSHTRQERKRLEEIAVQVPAAPQIPQGAVVVLLAFPEEEVPEACALRQSIEFAVEHGSVRFPVMFREARSSFECAQVAGEILSSESVRLLLFAGDEGSATTLALLGDKYRVPILLLTGYAHSLTRLSDYVFEFLPSRCTQSSALAEFAVEDLKIRSFLELVVSNAEGHALEEGFRGRVEKTGAVIEAVEWYSQNASSIRASLRNLFSASRGSRRQGGELSAAVSDSEMAALWGTRDGEVLFLSKDDSLKGPPISGDEGLFFAIPSGRAADMASQIGSLPQSTVLLGNSAWIDAQSLEEFPEVSENLIVSAPLLPDVEAVEGLQQLYEDSVGRRAGLWELLGLDAVSFLAGILQEEPDSPRAVCENLLKSGPFTGASVRLDFRGERENKAVRILRYENGTFTALK
ncbi:MAG: ABC transporter substrate-binding protein, partial [bacterium]